jgi:hypothetical protein
MRIRALLRKILAEVIVHACVLYFIRISCAIKAMA